MTDNFASTLYYSDKAAARFTARGEKKHTKTRFNTYAESSTCSSSTSPSLGPLLSSNGTPEPSIQGSLGGSTEEISASDDSYDEPKRPLQTPSWSSSDGSTYISEAVIRQNRNTGRAKTTKSSHVSKPSQATKLTKNSEEEILHLNNVQYFSSFEEASTNSGLSPVAFIEKEDTAQVFCRRLVPLEIPLEESEDDEVSGVSSPGSCSISTIDSERKSTKRGMKRLSDVDYLSTIDVTDDHEDISTVGYKLPYRIAHEAFDRTKVPPSTRLQKKNQHQEDVGTKRKKEKTLPYVPNHIEMNDSTPSFSSIEPSLSDGDASYDASNSDGRSDEAVRPAKATKNEVETSRQKQQRNADCTSRQYQKPKPLLKNKSSEGDDESSADARIRNLKNKIKALQASSSEGEVVQNPNKSLKHHKVTIDSNDKQRQIESDTFDARIKQLKQTTQEVRRKRNANYVSDTTGGLELADTNQLQKHKSENSTVDLPDVKINISPQNAKVVYGSVVFGNGLIPLEIPIERIEEMSAMDNESDYGPEKPDIENAVRSAVERKNNKSISLKKFRRETILLIEKGKEKLFVLTSNSADNKVQTSLSSIWAKHTAGRTTGEVVLIGTIGLSMFVLFVLLVIVLAGK